jgi:hypothetical protein
MVHFAEYRGDNLFSVYWTSNVLDYTFYIEAGRLFDAACLVLALFI